MRNQTPDTSDKPAPGRFTAHAATIPVTGADAVLTVPDLAAGQERAPQVPAFLLIHGWDSDLNEHRELSKGLAALGFASLVFDLTGHGKTRHLNDQVTRETGMKDVLAAYDLLASHPWAVPSRIGVLGSSYGAYLATLLTKERPVEWLGLRVPAQYRDEDWDEPKVELKSEQDLERYRREPTPTRSNASLAACLDFEGDVLIVASERDDTVPAQDIEDYVRACQHARSLTAKVIAGADHALSDPAQQAEFRSIVTQWVSSVALANQSPQGGGSGA